MEAMRFGSENEKDEDELGKYGIGLKTASLSQAKTVTVLSRQGSAYTGRRWTSELTRFFITKNEVDLSRSEADHFHLYRLFDFRKEPHLFSFRGAVDNHCHLDPITFHARFS